MEIISTIALISINETLAVQAISFIVFMVILNRVMVIPLRGSMTERETYIENLWTDIAASVDEMQAISDQIENQEASARQAARSIQKEIETAGSLEARDILDSARQDVTRLRQRTKNEIDTMLKTFRENLKKESESIALDLMEKTLSRRLSP